MLMEPPSVRNKELEADEDMELSTSWSRRNGDRSKAPSKSSTDEAAAKTENHAEKKRPSKGKRDRYKNLVHRLKAQILENPEAFTMDEVVLPPSLQANDNQRRKLIHEMKRYQDEVLASLGR